MEKEKIYSHIKVTEDTTLAKLSTFDHIKLLFSKLHSDDVNELAAAGQLTTQQWRLKASLYNFIKSILDTMTKNNRHSATAQLSSKYMPYFDDICNDVTGFGRFYNFELEKKDLPASVDYLMMLRISKKEV